MTTTGKSFKSRMAETVAAMMLRASLAGRTCLSKQTCPQKVRKLIQSLRPVLTEAPLIRVGPAGDGGYLIPDSLTGIRACFSPGVSTECGFELQCARMGMDVFMADGSVEAPPLAHERFRFTKKHIGLIDDAHTMTLDTWISQAGVDERDELLLQMDIEGFEYPAIASLSPERLKQFRFIVVEFHRLYLLWSSPYFELMEGVFRKLLGTHLCTHIHPNNVAPFFCHAGLTVPSVMEFTFMRQDALRVVGTACTFPHALDSRNNQAIRDRILPRCWQHPCSIEA